MPEREPNEFATASSQRSGQLLRLATNSKCTTHNEDYALFCVTEKKLLCLSCVYKATIHKHHQILPLKSAGPQLESEIRSLSFNIKDRLLHVDDSLRSCNEMKQQVLESTNFYLQIVQNEFKKLQEVIQSRAQQIEQQLQKYYCERLEVIAASEAVYQNLRHLLQDYMQTSAFTGREMSVEKAVQLFQISRYIKKNYQKQIDAKPVHEEQQIVFDFHSKHLLINEIQSFGKYKVKSSDVSAPLSSHTNYGLKKRAKPTPRNATPGKHAQELQLTECQPVHQYRAIEGRSQTPNLCRQVTPITDRGFESTTKDDQSLITRRSTTHHHHKQKERALPDKENRESSHKTGKHLDMERVSTSPSKKLLTAGETSSI